MEETKDQGYSDGFELGWNLAEETEMKRIADTMTEADILAIGNMFMDFYEHIVAETATPYETGFVAGVSEFAKSIDKSATQSAAIS